MAFYGEFVTYSWNLKSRAEITGLIISDPIEIENPIIFKNLHAIQTRSDLFSWRWAEAGERHAKRWLPQHNRLVTDDGCCQPRSHSQTRRSVCRQQTWYWPIRSSNTLLPHLGMWAFIGKLCLVQVSHWAADNVFLRTACGPQAPCLRPSVRFAGEGGGRV